MRYAYPCNIVRDKEEERASGREAYTVAFPDVHGANTGGWSWEEALEMAKDCLGVALGMYVKAREDIPAPSPLGRAGSWSQWRPSSRPSWPCTPRCGNKA